MGRATCTLCVTVLICLLTLTSAATAPSTNTTTSQATTTTTTSTTTTKETTTTKSQSPETSTQTTTTTTAAAATETPPLGGNCSDDRHFEINNKTCLPVTDLNPTNLTVTNMTGVEYSNVNLSWSFNDRVKDLALDISVTAVLVESNLQPSTRSCNVTQQTAKCRNLIPGSRYNFTVTVSFNTSDKVFKGSATTQGDLSPAIPGKINSTESSLTAPNVTLKWRSSAGKVDHYIVTYNGSQADINSSKEVLQEVQLYDLLAVTNYSVFITAYSHSLASEPRTDTFRTNSAVPEPPQNVSVSDITNSSMKVSWVPTSKPNGDIKAHDVCVNYKVYNDTPFIAGGCQRTSNGTITSLMMNNLTAGTYYQFSVYTVNDVFTSKNSAQSGVTRTLLSVPGQVTNLKGIPHNNSIFITWNRPSMPNGDIIKYEIKWSKATEFQKTCLVYLKPENSSVTYINSCINVTELEPIKVNQHNMTYNITDLKPNTMYSITVTAYTSEGAGKEMTITNQTSVAVPDRVTNVNAMALNATAVIVSWTIPKVNPGPVNYSVAVIDLILKNNGIPAPSCTVIGYNSSSCEIGKLEEFWMYKFTVVGETNAGSSEAAESNNITTNPALPGKIQGYSEILYNNSTDHCDATILTFHWMEPNLRDRNCNITQYAFYEQDNLKSYFNVPTPDPYRETTGSFDFNLTGLKPEENFTFTVHPVCGNLDGSNNSNTIRRVVNMGACAPPPWTTDEIEKIEKSDSTPSSFTIEIPENLFSNKEQGSIKEKGLVIIPYGTSFYEKDTSTIDVEKLAGYEDANPNFQTLYKIILTLEEGNEMKIQIGKDGTCSKTHRYCNGPLPAEFTFRVAVYACTNHRSKLCTVSSALGPYTTKARPTEEGSSSGWIIAVAILVVFGIVLGAFAFLWYRGFIDPKKWIPWKGGGGGGNDGFTPIEEIQRNRPILVGRYPSVLQEMHKDTNLILAGQYDDINKLGQMYADRSTSDAAREESNTPKNRWVNILPFDHSRVKLQQIDDDDPTTDYINANYMPGFNNKREYIATQGPLPGTIDDFWRMVWEHNVSVIVMLTQCKEGNRIKCEKYWPDELREAKQYDEVVVNPVSISPLDKYNISIFNVSVNDQTRQVIHFHYLDFPDFSANVEYDHFINFVRTVRSHVPRDMTGPMVVHCSAGVGRTGTFIIIDRLNLYLNSPDFSEGDEVDIFGMVAELRENRVSMVQTESQYIMIHDCFEKMLEDKKKSMEQTELQDHPYENVNEAFDPYPDVLYENVNSTQNTEL